MRLADSVPAENFVQREKTGSSYSLGPSQVFSGLRVQIEPPFLILISPALLLHAGPSLLSFFPGGTSLP